MFFIYVLRSTQTQHYYVGSTEDVNVRLIQYNAGKSKSTRAGVPWELIHSESFETRSDAIVRERKIKARGIARYLCDIEKSEIG